MLRDYLYSLATDQQKGIVAGLLKCLLWVASMIFGLGVLARGLLYRSGLFSASRLTQPVISVGNLSLGGTGKTPLVQLVAELLIGRGLKPVILTRGYMTGAKGSATSQSDEAQMLRNALPGVPVLAGAGRVASARRYLRDHAADVFVLDDGFQHWRLKRDLDIVAIDATNPWGNGYLLPRGILREPKRALARAHVCVITRTDLGAQNVPGIKNAIRSVNPAITIIESVHKPVCFRDVRSGTTFETLSLRNQKIYAASSIGAPEAFIATLTRLGAEVDQRFDFKDHHQFTAEDISRVVGACRDSGLSVIVMTEKDAEKVGRFIAQFPENIRVLSLKIKLVLVQGEGLLSDRINSLL